MSATWTRPKDAAAAAADETCPRCGGRRAADQRYCLECGLPLPRVVGAVPSLRRRWVRRLGWYPGDWVWTSLATLAVAAAGAAAAIAIGAHRDQGGPSFAAATADVSVSEPTVVTPVQDAGTRPRRPALTVPPNGRLTWPASEIGWTVVLLSYPKTTGRVQALAAATRAAKAGLQEVGILDSGRFASLQPGYFVVFTGIYSSKSDADAALATARSAGFAGPYSRQIAR